MIAVLFITAVLAATQPQAPNWGSLPADTLGLMETEGIQEQMYERLVQGDILTERRPVPAGKTGVHLAAFGILHTTTDRLWNAIEDCERLPEFMPHMVSCRPVRPDHALLPNHRWEELALSYKFLFFRKNVRIVNEATLEAPNYLGWKMVRGDAKENQGYYRIITITPDIQLLVYDTLNDPGIPVASFIQTGFIEHSLPGIIEAIRGRVGSPAGLGSNRQ